MSERNKNETIHWLQKNFAEGKVTRLTSFMPMTNFQRIMIIKIDENLAFWVLNVRQKTDRDHAGLHVDDGIIQRLTGWIDEVAVGLVEVRPRTWT